MQRGCDGRTDAIHRQGEQAYGRGPQGLLLGAVRICEFKCTRTCTCACVRACVRCRTSTRTHVLCRCFPGPVRRQHPSCGRHGSSACVPPVAGMLRVRACCVNVPRGCGRHGFSACVLCERAPRLWQAYGFSACCRSPVRRKRPSCGRHGSSAWTRAACTAPTARSSGGDRPATLEAAHTTSTSSAVGPAMRRGGGGGYGQWQAQGRGCMDCRAHGQSLHA